MHRRRGRGGLGTERPKLFGPHYFGNEVHFLSDPLLYNVYIIKSVTLTSDPTVVKHIIMSSVCI